MIPAATSARSRAATRLKLAPSTKIACRGLQRAMGDGVQGVETIDVNGGGSHHGEGIHFLSRRIGDATPCAFTWKDITGGRLFATATADRRQNVFLPARAQLERRLACDERATTII